MYEERDGEENGVGIKGRDRGLDWVGRIFKLPLFILFYEMASLLGIPRLRHSDATNAFMSSSTPL